MALLHRCNARSWRSAHFLFFKAIYNILKMKPLISEFSYGFALTNELASGVLGELRGAPIFPSLIQEGRDGGGYDVSLPLIGMPLFLQFKLSHKMIKSTASEWLYFGGPYYRMHLRSRRYSRQHSLLIQLDEAEHEVFYVAPYFYQTYELSENFLTNNVADNSIWIEPSAIGELPDLDDHYVSFNRSEAYVCSQNPQLIKRTLDLKSVSKRLDKIWNKKQVEIDAEFFLNIIDIIDAQRHFKRPLRSMYKPKQLIVECAKLASFISRSILGAELIIVTKTGS